MVKAMPSRGGPPPFPIRCEPTRCVCQDEVRSAEESWARILMTFSFLLVP